MGINKTSDDTLDCLIRKLFLPGKYERAIPSVQVECDTYRSMRLLSQQIRSNVDWITGLETRETRERWIAEYCEKLEESALKAVFDKLNFLASLQPEYGAKLSDIDYVWFSDALVGPVTRASLKQFSILLENDPEHINDKIPYNGAHLIKPIDPLLFPFATKHSRVLAKPIASPKDALSIDTLGHNPSHFGEWRDFISENYGQADPIKYQYNAYLWSYTYPKLKRNLRLPAEFSVDSNGSVSIESYINNLHPIEYSDFYPTIASAFSCLLPLFEQTLTDIAHFQYSRSFPVKENLPLRPIVPYSLRGRHLQVVVEMSNIMLTPDNPEYTGTVWFAGKKTLWTREIIATGMYCYDSNNIVDGGVELREYLHGNGLEFRDSNGDSEDESDEESDNHSDDDSDEHIDEVISQEVGIVKIKPGRCFVYSNVYQSRDTAFNLCDPSKPGCRKMLVFYLIDPSLRVPSTAMVPPQQQNWWARDVRQIVPFANLPNLVWDLILDYIDYPMSLKSARKIRNDILSDDGDDGIYESARNIWFGYEARL